MPIANLTMNSAQPKEIPAPTDNSSADFRSEAAPPRGRDLGFNPRLYPTARCVSEPDLSATESSAQIQREFCTVYYELNCLHARLQEMRRAPGTGEPAAEREVLVAIEKCLRWRDELEDRYAPLGVIAEAIAQDGFTREIRFTFGDRNVLRWQRTRLVSSTAILFFNAGNDSARPAQLD